MLARAAHMRFVLTTLCLLIAAGEPHPVRAAQVEIGVAAMVNPAARGTPPDADSRVLQVGVNVVANERIVTTRSGQAQMLFLDQSAFTVGPNSDLTLDEFVYDPATDTGKLALTATKGVFRFVGGRISKKTPVTLRTPTAIIGIRGGIALVNVAPNGATRATFLFGDQMTVETPKGRKSVTRPGFSVEVESTDAPPSDPAPSSDQELGESLAGLEGGLPAEEDEGAEGAGAEQAGSAEATSDNAGSGDTGSDGTDTSEEEPVAASEEEGEQADAGDDDAEEVGGAETADTGDGDVPDEEAATETADADTAPEAEAGAEAGEETAVAADGVGEAPEAGNEAGEDAGNVESAAVPADDGGDLLAFAAGPADDADASAVGSSGDEITGTSDSGDSDFSVAIDDLEGAVGTADAGDVLADFAETFEGNQADNDTGSPAADTLFATDSMDGVGDALAAFDGSNDIDDVGGAASDGEFFTAGGSEVGPIDSLSTFEGGEAMDALTAFESGAMGSIAESDSGVGVQTASIGPVLVANNTSSFGGADAAIGVEPIVALGPLEIDLISSVVALFESQAHDDQNTVSEELLDSLIDIVAPVSDLVDTPLSPINASNVITEIISTGLTTPLPAAGRLFSTDIPPIDIPFIGGSHDEGIYRAVFPSLGTFSVPVVPGVLDDINGILLPFAFPHLTGRSIVSSDEMFATFELLDPNGSFAAFAFAGEPTLSLPTTGASFYRLRDSLLFDTQLMGMIGRDSGDVVLGQRGDDAAIVWSNSSPTGQVAFGAFTGGVSMEGLGQDLAFSVGVGSVETAIDGSVSIVGRTFGISLLGSDGTAFRTTGGAFQSLCACDRFDPATPPQNDFFGENPNYFVLSSPVFGPSAPRPNVRRQGTDEGVFVPVSVFEPVPQALGIRTPHLPGGDGLEGQFFGFAGGVGVSIDRSSGFSAPYSFAAVRPSQVNLRTDPSSNKAQMKFDLRKTSGGSDLLFVTLGDSDPQIDGAPPTQGRSAFIDDRRFVAAVTCDLGGVDCMGLMERSNSVTLSAGGAAVPLSEVPGLEGNYASCTYCGWGLLAGEMSLIGSGGEEFERFAGFWTAGSIKDITQVPMSGSASYQGHMVAFVERAGQVYIGRGSTTLTVNFGGTSTGGTLSVSNFDGGGLQGAFSGLAGSSTPAFRGTLVGTGDLAGVNGSFDGAFFASSASNPVAAAGGAISGQGSAGGDPYRFSGIHLQTCASGACVDGAVVVPSPTPGPT
jgi:hypothetical protein